MNTLKGKRVLRYTGRGTTSGKNISVEIEQQPEGHGIKFEIANGPQSVLVPALAKNVVGTLRNTVLGSERARLCIVEHFLAAASLCGLNDLLVRVDGPEMPLGDGSARLWVDLFESSGWRSKLPVPEIPLPEPIHFHNGDRLVVAIPGDEFSVSYLMDWDHPMIGRRWQSWSPKKPINEIAIARTFGSLAEHKTLGIGDEAVSLTADGFDRPLYFEDEPVRHKLLDLIGDLTLSGINPMAFRAAFFSIKAGHELDVKMAAALSQMLAER